jgi:hypothetical protein
MDQIIVSHLDGLMVSQRMFFERPSDHVNDVAIYSCVSHVRKSAPIGKESLISEWSIILSLKIVSISHSCPRIPDQCDVITPPIYIL